MSDQFYYIALAIFLAVTIQPLRRMFEKVTDRIFFRDRYITQDVLNATGAILTSERLLGKLLHDSLAVICENLRLIGGQFVILDKGQISQVAEFGKMSHVTWEVPTLHQLATHMLVSDKLEAGDELLRIMTIHSITVSVPLYVRNELVGFLFLADKRSGSIYSHQDLDLLEAVAPALAATISNAEAYKRISSFNVFLQDEVRHATHSLRLANQNLKAMDKTKDEFLSITSHQLRTPLATIEGYLSLMLHGDAGDIPPQQEHFLKSTSEAAQRMAEIVREILDISTINAGRFSIMKQPTDLESVTIKEVENLTSMAKAKGLALSYQGPSQPLPRLELDKSKITQVISNLIDNAIHYTEKGAVQVILERINGKVRLSVKDSGIGVPEVEKTKLFNRFFRAPNARLVRPDGSGLGLFLIKNIVEAHGGKVIFESKEGQGSVFGFEVKAPLL